MLLTDPPYGTTRNFWDVPLPLPELWEAVKWAVKPEGAVLFFAQCPYDKVLGASNLAMLRYEWVWYKSRCTGFLNARRAPLKKTENILVFYQKSPAYFPQFEQGKPYKKIHRCSGNSPNYGKFERTSGESDGRRFPGNVLAFPTVTTTVHPTQKPFGHTPAEPDPEVVKIAAEQLKLEPTRENPLHLNDANPAKGRKAAVAMLEANQLPITDENIFIAASCSDKGIRFLKGEGTIGVRKIDKKAEAEKAAKQDAAVTGEMTVSVNGKSFGVKLSGNTAEINGRKYEFGVTAGIAQVQKQVAEAASSGSTEQFKEIHSTLPGAVVRILVKPGSPVKEGESILVLEAMKMETMVTAPVSGVLASCQVKEGEQVQAGALLAVIKH